MSKKALVFLVVAALALPIMPLTFAIAATDPAVEDVTQELMCQCGCGMTIAVCRSSMECIFSQQATDVVGQQIAAGRTKQQILDYFVGIYGEKILAAPTKSGFNVTAWVMPFVGIAAGLAVFARVVLMWRRRTREAAAVPVEAGSADQGLQYYEQLVDQQLKDFE